MSPLSEASFLHTLKTLCQQRNIDAQIFEKKHIPLEADFSAHVAWAFNHIYSIPYPHVIPHYLSDKNADYQQAFDFNHFIEEFEEDFNGFNPCRFDEKNQANTDLANKKQSMIARFHHGIQHVSRAAFYAPIFANFLRIYDAIYEISRQDLQLIKIAILFHDSARMDEDEDLWTKESAILLYSYLKYIVKISEDKAILLAESVANKDAIENNYNNLIISDTGIAWIRSAAPKPRNPYQIIIHEVDCADIMRVITSFSESYLDSFKLLHEKENKGGLKILTLVLNEIKQLIDSQGDDPLDPQSSVKINYENTLAYQEVVKSAAACPLLLKLYHADGLIKKSSLLTLKNSLEARITKSDNPDQISKIISENLSAHLQKSTAHRPDKSLYSTWDGKITQREEFFSNRNKKDSEDSPSPLILKATNSI